MIKCFVIIAALIGNRSNPAERISEYISVDGCIVSKGISTKGVLEALTVLLTDLG